MSVRIIRGDCRKVLQTLDADSVNCCVTSPPYWGLRDYGCEGQIGLEKTPEDYVSELVAVFREVRRVLRAEGTVWLNLGDTFASKGGAGWQGKNGQRADRRFTASRGTAAMRECARRAPCGLKPKDLVGIPWRVAFALQADGWYLRSDVIWAKPNPTPESVGDRPTKAHEYVFLLTKSARYWYDAGAIREPDSGQDHPRTVLGGQPSLEPSGGIASPHRGLRTVRGRNGLGRNARTVWTFATQPFSGAHFATMPPALAEKCILAGCPNGGTVLDPFGGLATVPYCAVKLHRRGLGFELNPSYFTDGVSYCRAAAEEMAMPTLFDLEDVA